MTRLMVYNCRGRYEARTGGTPLAGTITVLGGNAGEGRKGRKLQGVFALVLVLTATLVLAGCGGAGSGDSQPSGGDDQDARSSGGETAKLGTPSLGREDAPVVMTEFSDYQ